MRRLTEKDFFARIRLDVSGCAIYTGPRANGSGHGSFGRRGLAHRISYTMHFGPVPAGMVVMHSCDNPPCVNPAHLTIGTQADNLADMTAKGRRAPMPASNTAKTHCLRGHPLSGENLYRCPAGKRSCRTCRREHMSTYRAKRRAA